MNIRMSISKVIALTTTILFTLFGGGATAQNKMLSNENAITAIRGLITRVIPGYEDQFELEIIMPNENGEDLFEVAPGRDQKIALRGNNAISLASAFNWYLKYTCNAQLSWFGDQLELPAQLPLPANVERRMIQGKYRVYFNYCTISYTAPWWDWERWQREIDFMAMNGINMPLQPIGLDAVWYNTLVKLGFSDLEARTFLVGPAHQAWQWMTNIEGFAGPLPLSWINSHKELAQKIFSRQLELGMHPIQQCFVGYVPKQMKDKFPEAKIEQQPEWHGFEGVSQLDPLDPLFERIGRIFMEEQRAMFGAHGFYAADPFHESAPPVKGDDYLHQVGQTIYKLIDQFDPEGTVVMQAWSIRKPITIQFPKDRLIVLDLDGSTYGRTDNFWGYPFVAGNLHNFGGRINMHGDLALIASNQYLTAKERASNVVGTGLFMESIVQNPTYYALAFEMPFHSQEVDLDIWLDQYVTRIYGQPSSTARKAWGLLARGPYGPGTNDVEKSSIIAARPAIDIKKSGPNEGFGIPYPPGLLIEAQGLLLADGEALRSSTLYRFDLIDLQRQIMSNLGQAIHKEVVVAYDSGDLEGLKKHSECFLSLLLDVDRLLATRTEWNFDQWITEARAWGETDQEKDLFEFDATSLITYWGFTPGYTCQQFDYSWREWSGHIRRYYYPRWKMFYDMLYETLAAGMPYSEAGVKMSNGREAFRGNSFYDKLADWEIEYVSTPKEDIDPIPRGDQYAIAKEMYDKYKELADEYYKL